MPIKITKADHKYKVTHGGKNMPVKIRKVNGYRVSHSGKVSAKKTTKEKAEAQANLLRGIAHGWKPSKKK